MQNRKPSPEGSNNNNNNDKNRNTSYYRARVGAKPKKESSVFIEKAKKRQLNNYRLAMIVLVLLMIAFTGVIYLGIYLNGVYLDSLGINGEPESSADTSSNLDMFIPPTAAEIMPGNPVEIPVTESIPPLVDIPAKFYEYNGVYLDVAQIKSLEQLQIFIDKIKARGINAVNIDIKKDDGSVPFHVNGDTDAISGIDNQIKTDIKDIIKMLHDNELCVSGTIACFKDNLAGTIFVNYCLRDSSTAKMRWVDSTGSHWLNPYSSGARDYIKSIAANSAALGFDEIIFSWFFFPDVAKVSSISYEDDGRTKTAVIKDFILELGYVTSDIAPNLKLGLNIPLRYFLRMPSETMGLNFEDLMDRCSFFTTSFAPADVPSGVKINGAAISNPAGKPYETVKALCGHFENIINRAFFRPSLQAFGDYGEDQVLYQKQALFEYNISVWQLVNYENNY